MKIPIMFLVSAILISAIITSPVFAEDGWNSISSCYEAHKSKLASLEGNDAVCDIPNPSKGEMEACVKIRKANETMRESFKKQFDECQLNLWNQKVEELKQGN